MTVTAVLLASVIIVAVVSILPSANADSNFAQTVNKVTDKCVKANEKQSEKKAEQAEDQAERHGEKFVPTEANCGALDGQ